MDCLPRYYLRIELRSFRGYSTKCFVDYNAWDSLRHLKRLSNSVHYSVSEVECIEITYNEEGEPVARNIDLDDLITEFDNYGLFVSHSDWI